jgi:hypothetical protein
MAVVAEVTALNLLARYGIEVIWKLHLDAATAHGEGQAEADRLIQIADAAEEWLRLIHIEYGLPSITN